MLATLRTPPWRSALLPRLAGLPLLPVGAGKDGKAPIDLATGLAMTGWQTARWSAADIAATDPVVVTAVGMRCGPDAGGLLALDIDGDSAMAQLEDAGCRLEDAGWQISRPTAPDRCKVLFRVPPDRWPADGSRRAGKVVRRTADGQQIEAFWGTGQIVVAGLHKPSGAQLQWQGGPEEVADIPLAWLAFWEAMEPRPEPSPRPAAPAPRPSHHGGGGVPLTALLPAALEPLALSGCAEGGRNAECFRLAVAAITSAEAAAADGIAVIDTPEDLVLTFAARCSPPLPEREALQCLRSAESQPRTPDPGLAERIAYQQRLRAKGEQPPPAGAAEAAPAAVATAERPKLPPMPVAGGGKRLRLAPDEVLQRLPQMLGRVRLNIRSGDVLTEGRGALTGNQISRLYLELSSTVETWPKDATADAVITLANNNPFDPVEEYLSGLEADPLPLEQWHRLDRHILGIDDPIAATFLPRYLVSAVARTMEPGCYVRQTPVLIGAQERGKTELGRILFGASNWVEGVGALDRDALQRAGMAWGVELAELDGVTRRRDQEQLKAFLTECIDTYQIRYDRCPERHPRRFVFWATANRPPLRDATGSTRFVCIPLPDRMLPLDWARQHRDAIWARALEQYRSGVTWLRTDEQERRDVEERNADFMELDPWADTIATYLREALKADREGHATIPVRVEELLNRLEVPKERQSSAMALRVGQIAAQLGWQHGRRRWKGSKNKFMGLFPPADGGHPAGHPGHPAGHPPGTPPDRSPAKGSGPVGHPGHPISGKVYTEGEQQQAAEPQPVFSGDRGVLGCPGCPQDQIDCSATDLPGTGGVPRGVTRGVPTPDRVACLVDGEPGWSRRAGPMRGVSVLVTHADGRQLSAGRNQITDVPASGP